MKVVSNLFFYFHPIFIVCIRILIYFNTDTYTNRILYLFSPGFFKLFLLFLFQWLFFSINYHPYYEKNGLDIKLPHSRTKRAITRISFYHDLLWNDLFIFRSWNQNLSFFIDPFISFLFGGLVLLGVLFFITTFWKISLHTHP